MNDDYVKFIRFAQRRIEMTGYGVISFITNHGFIDNATFRGMRESLLQDFDLIYILDCHGNIKKKNVSPNGLKDEGLFDIQQGVCISFFIKNNSKIKGAIAKVHYYELWGPREIFSEEGDLKKLVGGKYHWLLSEDIRTTPWEIVQPRLPNYYFSPQDSTYDNEYDNFISMPDIFKSNGTGILTGRDDTCVAWTEKELWKTVKSFANLTSDEIKEKYKLVDTMEWKAELAKKDIIDSGPKKINIIKINYRPFDNRYTYYTGKSKGFLQRPREIMKNFLLGSNVGIISTRLVKEGDFNHFYITDKIVESVFLSSATACKAYIFPAYTFKDKIEIKKETNLETFFISLIEGITNLKFEDQSNNSKNKSFGTEDCINYIYGILNSKKYRDRYNYRLRTDYPKIPIPFSLDFFKKVSFVGGKLRSMHLLEQPVGSRVTFPIQGKNNVDKLQYKDNKVFINKTQYFNNITPEVWRYKIGGYQVCDKWLKSRKGRKLEIEDVEMFGIIVGTIENTIKLHEELDKVMNSFGEHVFMQCANVKPKSSTIKQLHDLVEKAKKELPKGIKRAQGN